MKNLLSIVLSVVISSLVAWLIVTETQQKVAFARMPEVFQEFQLTQELEAKLNNVKGARKAILDSLELEIRVMSTQLNERKANPVVEDSIRRMLKVFNLKNEQFSSDNEVQASTYNQQIWQQINDYVKEFQESEDIDVLLGAKGDGSVMAGKSTLDVTDELIEFINLKYQGK